MKSLAGVVLVTSSLMLSGCAMWDRDTRDYRACAAIESLGSSTTEVDQIRLDALPHASARLGRLIHDYVRSSDVPNDWSAAPTANVDVRSDRLRNEIQARCEEVGILQLGDGIGPEQAETDTKPESKASSRSATGLEPGNPSRVTNLLESLDVVAENRSGYDRNLFAHWTDNDKDGCNSRFEVLVEESLQELQILGDCELVGGEWRSVYDGFTSDDPSDFDIDHLVPLAEAWDSGASEWSPQQREAFANALENPEALVAVSSSSNRSKSDKDPSEWLPPDQSYWCEYATHWVTLKSQWDLSVDRREKEALREVLAGCG